MRVLALESSCDETAAAVLDAAGVCSSVVASQVAIHRETGGVVPEVASRSHLEQLVPVMQAALEQAQLGVKDLSMVAATRGPGLASSLLVGLSAAKGLALGLGVPFFAINHLEGHLLSPFLHRGISIPEHLALVVSGGHTLLVRVSAVGEYELLGRSVDDAAGEAFDKVGKMLGLAYPAGPEIDCLAQRGDASRFLFPQGRVKGRAYDFSFSGLKTAVLYQLPELEKQPRESWLADLCASFQEAVVQVLSKRLIALAKELGLKKIAISGGVACNSRLRELAQVQSAEAGVELFLCEPKWSTDNAAMIAFAAWQRHQAGFPADDLEEDVNPNLPLARDRSGEEQANRSAKASRVQSLRGSFRKIL